MNATTAWHRAGLLGLGIAAQAILASSDDRKNNPVGLSPFVVDGSTADIGRYASLDSISAGRVRTNIMDLSQSVSVITSELIQDVSAGRILEAAKYISGVSESTLPTSWERTTVRGFLADGRTVDGFSYGSYPSYGFHNIDPVLIDRIEAVKGPNSILAPQPSSPGGTINLATKKPHFRDFGVASVQVGSFDANSGFLDVNRVAGDRLAVRFIGSVRYWDNWWKGSYVHATTLMPAFTWRFSEKAGVTVQYTYTDWKAQNYFGLPIDPASGTTTPARLLAGVPRDLDVYADDVYRLTHQHEFRVFFTAGLGKGVSMRLAGAFNRNSQDGPQMNTGPSTAGFGGGVDPLTGFWNPGLQYAQTPPYGSSPLSVPATRTFIRSGARLLSEPRQFNLQNDYAYILENDSLKSTSLVGFAYADLRDDHQQTYSLTAPPFAIDRYVDTPWTLGALNVSKKVSNRFVQGYVAEALALFQKRLILNAAGSWQTYRTRVRDLLAGASAAETYERVLPSYGVVFKPYGEAVSLYYSRTRQSSANALLGGGLHLPRLASSRQDEFGVRTKVWDDRLYLVVSHFDIEQANFSIAHPGNLATPPPNPPLPPLYSDRRALGWEYELRASLTRNLSLIGSYTRFKNRDENGVEFRGVAEKAGALLASYAFDREKVSALAGFRIALGFDYLGKRPGDSTPDFTIASTAARPIPNQPTFYLESRTLANLTLAYGLKRHWSMQVNVDNLFDQEYLLASAGRGAIFPGTPRNLRVSVKHGF